MKGKDFFSRKSKHDNFYTPYSMTEQLLENEKFDYSKTVLEPACGNLAIVKILEKYFNQNKIEFTDINDEYNSENFFNQIGKFNYIITNPPNSLWDEFVKKAKQVAIEKFAFLGRLEFLTGIKRFNEKLYFDYEYPLTRVYMFVRKVNLTFTNDYPCLRKDGKYPAGMYHYAWFIFEKQEKKLILKDRYITEDYIKPKVIIKWIDNNKYILRSDDK